MCCSFFWYVHIWALIICFKLENRGRGNWSFTQRKREFLYKSPSLLMKSGLEKSTLFNHIHTFDQLFESYKRGNSAVNASQLAATVKRQHLLMLDWKKRLLWILLYKHQHWEELGLACSKSLGVKTARLNNCWHVAFVLNKIESKRKE